MRASTVWALASPQEGGSQEGTVGKRGLRHHQVQGRLLELTWQGQSKQQVSTRPLQESATGGATHLKGPESASRVPVTPQQTEAKDLAEWGGKAGVAGSCWSLVSPDPRGCRR